MATTLATASRNAAADAITALIDAGAAAGKVVFLTSGDAEVATCPMSDPSFGAAVSGVATANAITSDTSTNAGTIAKAEFRDSDDNVVYEATCGLVGSGEPIELSSLTYALGEKLDITSMLLTVAASS